MRDSIEIESILDSIKKLLGIADDMTRFDADICMHINTAFSRLYQLGVGAEPFYVTNSDAKWSDFTGDDNRIEAAKSYIFVRVKMLFDPPTSSSVLEAYKITISEMEWRLEVTAETTEV